MTQGNEALKALAMIIGGSTLEGFDHNAKHHFVVMTVAERECIAQKLWDAGYRLIDPKKLTVLSDEEFRDATGITFIGKTAKAESKRWLEAQLSLTLKQLGVKGK